MSFHDAEFATGACMTLPYQAVDRYFYADANNERFEAETARAICGRCAVKAACLLDAITTSEPPVVIRAGHNIKEQQRLRREHRAGAPAAELVERALANERPIRRVWLHPRPTSPNVAGKRGRS